MFQEWGNFYAARSTVMKRVFAQGDHVACLNPIDNEVWTGNIKKIKDGCAYVNLDIGDVSCPFDLSDIIGPTTEIVHAKPVAEFLGVQPAKIEAVTEAVKEPDDATTAVKKKRTRKPKAEAKAEDQNKVELAEAGVEDSNFEDDESETVKTKGKSAKPTAKAGKADDDFDDVEEDDDEPKARKSAKPVVKPTAKAGKADDDFDEDDEEEIIIEDEDDDEEDSSAKTKASKKPVKEVDEDEDDFIEVEDDDDAEDEDEQFDDDEEDVKPKRSKKDADADEDDDFDDFDDE